LCKGWGDCCACTEMNDKKSAEKKDDRAITLTFTNTPS
jgi:hypothetical protein